MLLALLGTNWISACIPYHEYYFRPSASGGELQGACGSPLDSLLLKTIDGLTISVSVNPNNFESSTITIILEISPGQSIRLIEPYIILKSKDNLLMRQLAIDTIDSVQPMSSNPSHLYEESISPSSNMSAANQFAFKGASNKSSGGFFRIKVSSSSTPRIFLLELPRLLVNGVEKTLPVINFEYLKYSGLRPLMC